MITRLDDYLLRLEVLDEHCTRAFIELVGGIEIKNIFNAYDHQYSVRDDGGSDLVFSYEELDGGFQQHYIPRVGKYYCNFITGFRYQHPDQGELCG